MEYTLPPTPTEIDKKNSKETIIRKYAFSQVIGGSKALMRCMRRTTLVATSNATVLFSGQTGTGKELFARSLHHLSKRQAGPFISINCGAIPVSLLENELFGHKKGAFTGATRDRRGLIEAAQGGTLFLDEVEALTFEAQSKLLRLLQNRTYRPLGQTQEQAANVRFVAASNTDLKELADMGQFRSDLLYRFTITINIPPLAERQEDIPQLAGHFIRKYCQEYGLDNKTLCPTALRALCCHTWPGNIRELENVIHEAVLVSSDMISMNHIKVDQSLNPQQDISIANSSFAEAKTRCMANFERKYLRDLLAAQKGNVSAAARAAQFDRKAFIKMLRKYQIDPSAFRNVEDLQLA